MSAKNLDNIKAPSLLIKPISFSKSPKLKFSYLPALDGIRGLAMLFVLLFHFSVPYTQGGFLGVDLFFVLSGYLITSQLWLRWHNAPIRLWDFWKRRIRRLIPALWLLITGTTVTSLLLDELRPRSYTSDLLSAFGYVSNWWYIYTGQDYGAEWGFIRPPLLKHLWSLAVEEQFYLIWPLIIAAGLILFRKQLKHHARRVAYILTFGCLILATVSFTWMKVGASYETLDLIGIHNPSRWYYGTDSHAFPLMIGAALGLFRQGKDFVYSQADKEQETTKIAKNLGLLLGIGGLFGFTALVVLATFQSPWMYRYGFALGAVFGVCMLVGTTQKTLFTAILTNKIIRYFGTRSYSIYLWHWPVVCFTRTQPDFGWVPGSWAEIPVFLIRLGLSLLLAEISYRLVEIPVRTYGFRAIWQHLKLKVRTWLALFLAFVVFSTQFGYALAHGDKSNEEILRILASGAKTGIFDINSKVKTSAKLLQNVAPTPSAAPTTSHSSTNAPSPTVNVAPTTKPLPTADSKNYFANSEQLTAQYWGDSFTIGVAPTVQEIFKSLDVHGKVSEQAYTTFKKIRETDLSHTDVFILQFGNNGNFNTEDALDTVMNYAAKVSKRVLIIQPRVPRPWQAENRANIEALFGTQDHPKYSNVRVVDWYALSDSHPDWFADGVHPEPIGAREFAALVRKVVTEP